MHKMYEQNMKPSSPMGQWDSNANYKYPTGNLLAGQNQAWGGGLWDQQY